MAQIDITHEGKGAFASALGKAQVGDEIIYHIGEYAAGEHKRVAMASHGRVYAFCISAKRGHGGLSTSPRRLRPVERDDALEAL
jgi:hypothetical protein